MRVLLLGTTGYHPNERRHTMCVMLPRSGAVLDAGSAMFRVRRHLVTESLDIFISHSHLDHIVGLTYLFDVLYERPTRQVRIHAEAEKLEAIRRHLFAEEIFPAMIPAEFVPLDTPVTLADGGVVRHFPVEHPGGAVGFRLDWPDRSLAYVTDTTARPDAGYLEAVRGVDLLLHESYFADGSEAWAEKTGHSCVSAVARLAQEAGVGRLVLVHVNPLAEEDDPYGLDAVRQIFPATEIGWDNMSLEL